MGGEGATIKGGEKRTRSVFVCIGHETHDLKANYCLRILKEMRKVKIKRSRNGEVVLNDGLP